jgi:Ferritin-like domain
VGVDSSAGGFGGRRGFGRAAASLALALVAIQIALSGCGDSGHGAETDPEKGSDVEFLNGELSRELTILDVYRHGAPLLRGSQRVVGRRLLAQEQEYVDALTKTIRGLGGDTEAEVEELDFTGVRDQAAFLRLAYELESAALASYVDAATRLYNAAPRTLDTSLATGHAQHLVVLRQALGLPPAASIPEAFDGGEVPLPVGSGPGSGG